MLTVRSLLSKMPGPTGLIAIPVEVVVVGTVEIPFQKSFGVVWFWSWLVLLRGVCVRWFWIVKLLGNKFCSPKS